MSVQTSIATTVSVRHPLDAAIHQPMATTALHHATTATTVNDHLDHRAAATMTTLHQETIEVEHLHRETHTDLLREIPTETLTVNLFHPGRISLSRTRQTTRVLGVRPVQIMTIVAAMVEAIQIVGIEGCARLSRFNERGIRFGCIGHQIAHDHQRFLRTSLCSGLSIFANTKACISTNEKGLHPHEYLCMQLIQHPN